MFANKTRRPVGKDCPTPGGKCARGGGLRESVGQTKFLDLMSGVFPLRGELKPNSRRTKPRIPRKINDSKNSKRFAHGIYFKSGGPMESKICVESGSRNAAWQSLSRHAGPDR